MRKLLCIVAVLFFGTSIFAQTKVTGTVTEEKTGEPIPGANVKVIGKSIGTTTDFEGNFILETSQVPPFTIEITMVGLIAETVEITSNNQVVKVTLKEGQTLLDEVVVSASRTPERIMESPVTVERMDIRAIKNSSSPTFYDGLENLKGVDVNVNSLTFKSVNTRGFATFANTRFVQLVDGIDNSSPALNFTLGNLLGMSELDVNTVELLPGASSALYGANAFNGIMFMTSKNPFDHTGVSSYAKSGITSSANAGDNRFADVGVRMAYKFSDKFAAKASISYLKGTDWYATDYSHRDPLSPTGEILEGSTRSNNPSYDGLNTYGDEVSTVLDFDAIAIGAGALPPGASLMGSQNVSRTGYNEEDFVDYTAESVKADVALHYRPFGDDLEVIYNAKFGRGNTIYQGANRYFLKDFFMQQHKLEIKNDNFFVRGYVTDENAGNSYDSRFAGINVNRAWKSDRQWFTEYAGAYVQTFLGTLLAGGTPNPAVIHQQARAFADIGRLVPGTAEFDATFAKVTDDPNLATGAKFVDRSKIYHADVNYNFKELIDFADIQVGGSLRQYSLNSQGTIFTDYDGPINYNEYGAYTQMQKKFADDRLKFTGSIRYDKAQNFEGNLSPRVSLAYSAGAAKNHNFRTSFQTGFRNPTTQDQYIGLDVGRAFLVGSAPDNLDRYTTGSLPVSSTGQMLGFGSSIQLSGARAYDNAFTLASFRAFGASAAAGSPNPALLERSNVQNVAPEKVSAFEFGYRSQMGKVSIDLNAFYNDYEGFIATKTVIVPMYGSVDLASDITPLPPALGGPTPTALIAVGNGDWKAFQVYTNSMANVSSYGASVGLSTRMGGYDLGFNYTYAKLDFEQASDPDFEAGFNTPEHKFKASFGNPNVFENLGFNMNLRWNDEYLWQSTFQNGIIDARTVIDAQVSYTNPKIKSVFKIGGANIGGKEYRSAPGAGTVGSQYFVSWTINP